MQILRAAGRRPFLGGNLGTPLSVAALECLAFPPDDPPYQVSVHSPKPWQQGTGVGPMFSESDRVAKLETSRTLQIPLELLSATYVANEMYDVS
jgi:hypothetical protein